MADTEKIASLEGLTDEEVREVLDHISRLRAARDFPRGRAEAILPLAGSWWMAPSDTEQFLRDVVALRNLSNGDREVSL